ncbi:MAG: hypothetical protein SF182_19305 [Deltaproteobacteria bacterium]|nr:hypothetical protein [Deltaproteobacteria bacterium]
MRHKLVAAVLLIALGTSSSGCFYIHGQAPPLPKRVRLLPPDTPVEVTRKYQTFYYAWGLFSMTRSDYPQYIIEQEGLVEARITHGGLWEGILAGFIGAIAISGFIVPQNITIEGNRTPTMDTAIVQHDGAAPVTAGRASN